VSTWLGITVAHRALILCPVMTMHVARYHTVQITASQINCVVLLQASHRGNCKFVAVSQKLCKLAPKLLQNVNM